MEACENLIKRNLFLLLMIFTFASCNNKINSKNPPDSTPEGSIPVTVIDYTELDGCDFLLQMEDGSKLQPLKLKDEFKVDKMKLLVTFKYNDGMSVCMAGRMIELITVVKDNSNKK